MASRWMQAKLAIMARARKDIAHSLERKGHPVATANNIAASVAPLVEKYNGVKVLGLKGRPLKAVGKGQRQLDTRTFGNGERFAHNGVGDYYDLWDTQDRLVKRG